MAHAYFEFEFFGGKNKSFKNMLQQVLKTLKNAHAYFNRLFFSKSFGGKTKHGQTDVNKEITY